MQGLVQSGSICTFQRGVNSAVCAMLSRTPDATKTSTLSRDRARQHNADVCVCVCVCVCVLYIWLDCCCCCCCCYCCNGECVVHSHQFGACCPSVPAAVSCSLAGAHVLQGSSWTTAGPVPMTKSSSCTCLLFSHVAATKIACRQVKNRRREYRERRKKVSVPMECNVQCAMCNLCDDWW
jgi:hypothetical protein